MTTIILTIIGILLAASAALMVIFYGGDAFNAGATGASANTLQNAGTNAISASSMFKIDNGGTPPTSLSALTANGVYLKETPNLPQTIDGTTNVPVQSISNITSTTSGVRVLYSVSNVSTAVCDRINKNLKVVTVPTTLPTATTIDTQAKVACAAGTFYAVG